MAHTYKIKPLQWKQIHNYRWAAIDSISRLVIIFDVRSQSYDLWCEAVVVDNFRSLSKAQAFAEEYHIAKIREYLEALE